MNGIGSGMKRAVMLALASSVLIAACGSKSVATLPPLVTPTPAGVATETPAASDVTPSSPTPAPTPAPLPTDTAPAASPTASPTPAPTDTPVPGASPTSRASACTGTADHQAYFSDAAVELPFDVYCGALPTKWYLQSTAFTVPSGGQLTIQYKRFSGGQLDISEGNFCTGASACSTNVGAIGTANFGDLSGSLDKFTASPLVFVIYVAPGTIGAYTIKGTGLSQAEFVSLAAAMSKVPKS
jgi:hypothetical protein